MKAGDLFMVQYCAEHGSFRVLPLRTCEDLARLDMEKGAAHSWVVVGHASTEGEAYGKMKVMKVGRKALECGGSTALLNDQIERRGEITLH